MIQINDNKDFLDLDKPQEKILERGVFSCFLDCFRVKKILIRYVSKTNTISKHSFFDYIIILLER